jgi:hypothetical protein
MKHFFLIVLLLTTLYSLADEPINPKSNRHLISMVPQYAFLGGFRIDYDVALNQKHWLQLAPAVYSVSDGRMFNDYDKMAGFGFHLYHRYFPGSRQRNSPVYLSAGLIYQNYTTRHTERVNNSRISRNTHIQRAGFDLLMGVSSSSDNTLIMDFYAGMGFRHAFYKTDAMNLRRFDEGFFDIGYSGVIFIMGMRFGVFVK